MKSSGKEIPHSNILNKKKLSSCHFSGKKKLSPASNKVFYSAKVCKEKSPKVREISAVHTGHEGIKSLGINFFKLFSCRKLLGISLQHFHLQCHCFQICGFQVRPPAPSWRCLRAPARPSWARGA